MVLSQYYREEPRKSISRRQQLAILKVVKVFIEEADPMDPRARPLPHS